MLRCCRKDQSSYNGFVWPKTGTVKCDDWRPTATCGNGLHGWLKGEGDHSVWSHDDSDLWLVLAVQSSEVTDLGGKVKFPRCRVLYAGTREVATMLIQQKYPSARVIYGTATAGNEGTAISGLDGTACSG